MGYICWHAFSQWDYCTQNALHSVLIPPNTPTPSPSPRSQSWPMVSIVMRLPSFLVVLRQFLAWHPLDCQHHGRLLPDPGAWAMCMLCKRHYSWSSTTVICILLAFQLMHAAATHDCATGTYISLWDPMKPHILRKCRSIEPASLLHRKGRQLLAHECLSKHALCWSW